jgi:gliding motility-associated-like protein
MSSAQKMCCMIGWMLMGIVSEMSSQCVIINEVLINAAGDCDGSCVPNTAEWLELYNACATPVDIGCFVITDGDFAVTFPAGTTIAANGYLVVGSNNSNVGIDVNLATCNCTSGSDAEIGIFTNGNEQIALANAFGQIIDGIYWGAGQFGQTPNLTTDSHPGCPSHTITLSSSNPVFTQVPTAGDGQTVYRSCANSEEWLADGQNYTPGASNGDTGGSLAITSSDSAPCIGESVTLTVQGATGGVQWNTGATSTSITVQQPGNYSVTQNGTSGCGSQTSLSVTFNSGPSVNAGSGGIADCDGGLQLQGNTTAADYFWEPASGLSDPQSLSPTAQPLTTTTYTLHAIAGGCESVSSVVVVPECGELKVPNIFSPNGDSYNEVFRPEGKGVAQYSLKIFDRWGTLLFESTQFNYGWNGKVNNNDASAGTYYFILIAKDSQGRSLVGNEVLKGELTLIR